MYNSFKDMQEFFTHIGDCHSHLAFSELSAKSNSFDFTHLLKVKGISYSDPPLNTFDTSRQCTYLSNYVSCTSCFGKVHIFMDV